MSDTAAKSPVLLDAPPPALTPWRTVPFQVLRVLRAAATLEPPFSAPALAALLRCDTLDVLERLQHAADLGVPLEPAGPDAFSLPPALRSALVATLLPSLAHAWQQRRDQPAPQPSTSPVDTAPVLDSSSAPQPTEAASSAPQPTDPASAPDPASSAPQPTDPASAPDPASSAPQPTDAASSAPHPTDPASSPGLLDQPPADLAAGALDPAAVNPIDAAILAAAHHDVAHPAPLAEPTLELEALDAAELFVLAARPAANAPPPPPRPATRTRAAPQPPPRLEEAAEDADHLQLDFLAVAREAADRGEPDVAAETLRRALGKLGARPATPAHQRLRILGQIELARLQWQAAGPELGFTLNQALATLDSVRAEFGSDASNDLAAELCQVIAGICFDLGDVASLQRALEELAVARRLLQPEGETPRAARILNDQAAVLIRMGDANRARDLLRESRTYFRNREKDDPVAMRELAETDHLTAWLPLYATMVPGREQDGYRIAHERAAAAEEVYRQLDDTRELARVWETMGRLELLMQQHDVAMRHLEAAADVQRRLGDLTGLARTTDAMSDLLRQSGRDVEAIALLRQSVQYNRDKGSLIGLFHNRRAFTDLIVRLAGRPEHSAALQDLSLMLGAAEREVEIGRARATART
jgi:tetratricopeptide (TPR) repeat protein